jgi:uncharacterized protein (DUF2236 family)
MALHDRVAPPGMPPAVAAVATPAMRLLALGGLPKVVRERFGIPWSRADEVALVALRKAVRDAGLVVPHRLTRGPYLRSIRRMKHIAAPRPEAAVAS